MARKTFERKLYEWFKDNRDKISEESYNEYISFISNRYPEVLEEKNPGRPPAKEFDFLGNVTLPNVDLTLCEYPEVVMWPIFNLWDATQNGMARMAFCLLEMGILERGQFEDKRPPFKSYLKTLYNIFSYYKFGALIELDTFRKIIKEYWGNLDYYYPKEDREKDKKRVEELLPEIENKLAVWVQGIDWYDEWYK